MSASMSGSGGGDGGVIWVGPLGQFRVRGVVFVSTCRICNSTGSYLKLLEVTGIACPSDFK
jgi:hypothetical protein